MPTSARRDPGRAVIDADKPASAFDTANVMALRDLIGQIPAHSQTKPKTRRPDPFAASFALRVSELRAGKVRAAA